MSNLEGVPENSWWRKENIRARKKGGFSDKTKDKIADFRTCYVGERLGGMFTDDAKRKGLIDAKAAHKLAILGLDAVAAVDDDDFDEADAILRQVYAVPVKVKPHA